VNDDNERLARGNAERLATLLRDREGWRPEVQNGKEFWCFGVDGAARLVITRNRMGS
jgi:hypothetical protein